MDRIVILVDMDCFYVQVEHRYNSSLKGKPCAVVQYNSWKGGGTIAVSYEARKFGVTRQMRGDEAKKKCPDIQLVRVPENRGKADLTRYREAGAEVITVLCKFSTGVERASVDEAYVDVTDEIQERLSRMVDGSLTPDLLPQTFIAGYDTAEEGVDIEDVRSRGLKSWLESAEPDMRRLAIGALIAEEMRAAVYKETGFHCSAGISHNKMLAKIACGFHKPQRQTVLPKAGLDGVFKTVPMRKFRNLGGKLGHAVSEDLGVEYFDDMVRYTEKQLQARYGDKTGTWLYGVCRGIDDEPVRPRQLPKSTGCSKNFTGKNALDTRDKVKYWLRSLSEEVAHRLQREGELNNRVAKHLTVYVRQAGNPPSTVSRSCAVHQTASEMIARDCYMVIQNLNVAGNQQIAWSPAIICLGISASKFTDPPSSRTGNKSMDSFLSAANKPRISSVPGHQQKQIDVVTQQSKTQQNTSSKHRTIERFLSPANDNAEVPTGSNTCANEDSPKSSQIPKHSRIKTFFSPKRDDDDVAEDTAKKSKPLCSTTESGKVMQCLESIQSTSDSSASLNSVSSKKYSRGKFLERTDAKGSSFFARYKKPTDRREDKVTTAAHRQSEINAEKVMDGISKSTSSSKGQSAKRGARRDCGDTDPSSADEFSDHSDNVQCSKGRSRVDIGTKDTSQKERSSVAEKECSTEMARYDNLQEHGVERDLVSSEEVVQETRASQDVSCGLPVHTSEDRISCDQCEQTILVWDYPEHLDYHMALQLQEQDRAEADNASRTVAKTGRSDKAVPPQGGKKRGRPPGSTISTKKSKQASGKEGASTLHNFFKPI